MDNALQSGAAELPPPPADNPFDKQSATARIFYHS